MNRFDDMDLILSRIADEAYAIHLEAEHLKSYAVIEAIEKITSRCVYIRQLAESAKLKHGIQKVL